MTAPTYLTPAYITYAMIENLLHPEIKVTDIDDPELPGIYIGVIETLMAKGESYIIKTILSDYVSIPLVTFDNQPFENLYEGYDGAYRDTYISIIDMFTSSAIWQIFKDYFGTSGTVNGKELITQYANKISIYTNTYKRLDQAANPISKNAFSGLKRAINGSQRIAKVGRVPCGIPQGRDQAFAAFNGVPNLRWGFNR